VTDTVSALRSESDAHADGDWSDEVIRKRFTEAADEIERLRAEVEAWRSLDKVRLETIRQGLTEMRHLQALIDAVAAADTHAKLNTALDAILAAATPQEDDRA
jgi:hypothetical protein